MCEARQIESIKAPRDNVCSFPFTHNSVTYSSCAHPDATNQDIREPFTFSIHINVMRNEIT